MTEMTNSHDELWLPSFWTTVNNSDCHDETLFSHSSPAHWHGYCGGRGGCWGHDGARSPGGASPPAPARDASYGERTQGPSCPSEGCTLGAGVLMTHKHTYIYIYIYIHIYTHRDIHHSHITTALTADLFSVYLIQKKKHTQNFK